VSEETVEGPFDSVEEQVEAAHQRAVEQLRTKVQKAKSEALKKLSP